MNFVDTHCHIDLYDNPEVVMDEAEKNRIYTIAMTNLPSAFEEIENLLKNRKYIRLALGLHPQNAYRNHFELEKMFNLLDKTRYIGEIGLDYSTPDSDDRQVQKYVFNQILEKCSLAGNKILSIHSRHAESDVIDAIGTDFPGKIILHWFTGSKPMLLKAISNGYYFSINPAMISTKKGASLISIIPKNRLLTESDGPYVKVKNQPAQPVDVNSMLYSLSNLLGLDFNKTTKLIYDNFRKLLAEKH